MTFKKYTTTRLDSSRYVQPGRIQRMLAFVVDTFAHSRAAHPRVMCYKCYNESISLITRLSLNEFQASCYSHHRSQSALSETNWLLRVSGCNPYLESLPSYTDGAPPWTPTNRGHGITSRPLKSNPRGLTQRL